MTSHVVETALDNLWKVAESMGAEVRPDAKLSDYTTSRVGASTLGVVRCQDSAQVAAIVRAGLRYNIPLLTLGGGSNLLVGDASVGVERFDVVLLQQISPVVKDMKSAADKGIVEPGIEVVDETDTTVTVQVAAGVNWDTFVRFTVYHGWGGVECLSGIPGQVGATPVQNVGAYGVEVESVVERVQLVDRATGALEWEGVDQLELGYRTSNLKFTQRAVVTAVEFRLRKDGHSAPIRYRELARILDCHIGDRVPVRKVREAVVALRSSKGMVVCGTGTDAGGLGEPQQSGLWIEMCQGIHTPDPDTFSTGSLFTNPIICESFFDYVVDAVADAGIDPETMPRFASDGGVKLSAAWLIEHAGFTKGFPGEGAPARLSTRHTLALTNRGTATTADLLSVAERIRDGVWEQFKVELKLEPVLVGCALPPLERTVSAC